MSPKNDSTSQNEVASSVMDTFTCKFQDCDRENEVRDWCYKHYNAGLIDGTIKPLTTEDRFWMRVDKNGPIPERAPALGRCWLWTGNLSDSGYGRFGAAGRIRAHRFSWELHSGEEIPQGFQVDHLCFNPICVNPTHLEPTTGYINTMRGLGWGGQNKRKMYCPEGHEYTIENTYTDKNNMRHCRECGKIRARKYRAQKREGIIK